MGIRSRQRGVAAVELGLLMPILILLAFGITEFGRAFYQYNTLAKAVRDGVRYLTHYAPGDERYETHKSNARNLVVCGTTSSCSDASALVSGLKTSLVSICDRSNCPDHNLQPVVHAGTPLGQVNLVTVTVSGFRFTSLVPLITPNIMFGPISATMEQVL